MVGRTTPKWFKLYGFGEEPANYICRLSAGKPGLYKEELRLLDSF